jgi:hypothetical protein
MFNIGLNSVQFNLDSGYCAVIFHYSKNITIAEHYVLEIVTVNMYYYYSPCKKLHYN